MGDFTFRGPEGTAPPRLEVWGFHPQQDWSPPLKDGLYIGIGRGVRTSFSAHFIAVYNWTDTRAEHR